ncbi:MAG: ATP-binding protein [Proteobacteria bacterium]|nr:ATP-binding protein [Pseudomonadota bacterium]
MISNLENILLDQRELFESKREWVVREIDFEKYCKTPYITVVSGLRRCGKSTVMRQFAERYEDYHYINFDDERLINFTVQDFAEMMLLFQKQSPATTIFMDEIQNIEGWERFVRRIHDENYKIFVTGSNAKLLSSELGTHLTGRYLKVELFPFSFREVLAFTQTDHQRLTTKTKASILKHFDSFLIKGGMPEYLKYGEEEFLSRTYEDIIYRDIIVRHKIKETKSFRQMSHYLFSNFTSDISYNSLKNILGIKSPVSVKNYIGYLEESYLAFELLKYDYSLKQQEVRQKKIYVVDNGIRNSIAFYFSSDLGKLLENLVFIELKRRGFQVYMHRNKIECDFVVLEKRKVISAFQVCYVLNETNRKREIQGAVAAMDHYQLVSATILTYNQSETAMLDDGRKIDIVPIWQWLLDRS